MPLEQVHYLISDADVNKRVSSAPAAFGAIINILTKNDIDLKVKGGAYVALCLSILLYGSKIRCLREDLSIDFVTSISDSLESCAALPSLTQFATVFYLPAFFND
jgi:hypothetical protein